MLKKAVSVCVFVFVGSVLLPAQSSSWNTNCSNTSKVGCVLPDVYGPTGLTLTKGFHEAHFEGSSLDVSTALTSAIASRLTLLPLTSPASGFTYVYDRAAGVYTRTAESFGPIYAERAETIGRRKVSFGVAYQYFSFDSMNGVPLNNIPGVSLHASHTGPGGSDPAYEKDFITTSSSIDLFVNQATAFATVGVTNRFDISVAIPILNVNMKVVSAATLHRTAPPDPRFGQAHSFDSTDPLNDTFQSQGHASGFGDVTLRFKGTVLRGERAALAFATDFRIPSGDEMNLLGSGAWGVAPFLAGSMKVGRVTPHVNVGYEFNGWSVLAGDITTGTKGRLPNMLLYAAGADIGVVRRLSLAFDLLGQRAFQAPTIHLDAPYVSPVAEIPSPTVVSQPAYQQVGWGRSAFNVVSAAGGFKAQIVGQLLFTGNVLFQLNNDGLRAKVVPTAALSYSF